MKNKLFILFVLAFALKANISHCQEAKLKVTDISWPNPVNLNVGDVDEFVYSIKNIGSIGSRIDTIAFTCTRNSNIAYFEISGNPFYYFTYYHDSVLNNTVTEYFYNNYSTHPLYTLFPSFINYIDTVKLKRATGKGYLLPGDSIILHIPYTVIACGNDVTGKNTFMRDSSGIYKDTVIENNSINVETGTPLLAATAEVIDSGSFCTALPKHWCDVDFHYINNGTGYYPGDAQADSLRIYMYCNTGTGTIDISSIKINGIAISSLYITSYVSSPYNIYVIDLTNYPAGVNGHPFGPNTLCDMNGSGFADGLGEDSSFDITAKFLYDSTSCPPYVQLATSSVPNAFYLPAIGAEYTNMCYTPPYNGLLHLPSSLLPYQASYEYQSYSGVNTSATAPEDITSISPDFNFTICPYFSQSWTPPPFNFDCPKQNWSIVIPLPRGYQLDTNALTWYAHRMGVDTNYSNSYHFIQWLTDSSTCSSDTFRIQPIISEHYHDSARIDTVFINFGTLQVGSCGTPDFFLLSCINVPLELDCPAFGSSDIYSSSNDNLNFSLVYTCDSGCAHCQDTLTAANTLTYHHCPGSCTSIPYTDSVWSFLRTNLGSLNEDNTPTQYYSSCHTPYYDPNSLYPLINKSSLNTAAAYPGDQVEAIVAGGYGGLIPANDTNQYLQIRYTPIINNDSLFKLDPDIQSYFVLHGLTGPLSPLNGFKLVLPAYAPIHTNFTSGGLVEMDFSLNDAINYSFHSIYSRWISYSSAESFTDSAYIHLRVLPSTVISGSVSYGVHLLNLRTEFMCKQNGPDVSADTIHSCDSWGKKFNIYKPYDQLSWFNDNPTNTYCDSVSIGIGLYGDGAKYWSGGGDDFPDEFRPYYALDSTLTFTIPKGYLFSSMQLAVGLDNHDTNGTNNHFSVGWTPYVIPVTLTYRNNVLNSPDSVTKVVVRGIDNSCWPLIDQKYNVGGYYPYLEVVLNIQPVCFAPVSDTLQCTAGVVLCTQQTDTNFRVKEGPANNKLVLVHSNPVVNLQLPPTVNEYTNLITFTLNACDISSYDVKDGWVAFEDVGGYLFNVRGATLTDPITHIHYTGNAYRNADSGIIFNIGHLDPSSCDTLLFSAYVDSNSLSCPPPIGGDSGKMVIRYGNICSGILKNPDSTQCQNNIDTLYYHIYPSNLQLTNNGYSPDTVSLCGGQLIDSLTITSNELGAIADPEFWAVLQPGFTFDSVHFTYPCGGARDTNIHVPDMITGSITNPTGFGWNLNNDLKLDGLMGTLGLPPLSDSNTICVKVYLTMNCNYSGLPIQFYATGQTACDIEDTATVNITPPVKSLCCLPTCAPPADTFDVIIDNMDAKRLSRAMHSNYYNCKKILIDGTYTIDTTFTFYGCDVSLAPKALISIVDSSTLNIQEGSCYSTCSHLHAVCDTMWRGIFIHKGSMLYTADQTLIEDADTAVYAINTSTQEALYNLNVSTFNKNYKDIIVKPYPLYYDGYSVACLFTCRNFDSILASYPNNCVDPTAYPKLNIYGNWTSAPFATLLPPHIGTNTYIGWAVDTVGYLNDSSGDNTFDNMQYGIYGRASSMGIYDDLFQNIVNTDYTKAAITAKGTISSTNTLYVGASPTVNTGLGGNVFYNCTTGVFADTSFGYVDISYNKMINHNNAPGTYGVAVEAMDIPHDSLFIDQDTITNFNVGIACNLNTEGTAYINYNIINVDTCTSLNWTGIVLNESPTSSIQYMVDANIIKTIYRGIVGIGLYNSFINDNAVYLDTMSCSSYNTTSPGGIELQSCNVAQIGCNNVTAGVIPNSYNGIVESGCQNVTIINNKTTDTHYHINFNSTPVNGDNLWYNTMTTTVSGKDTAILTTSGANPTSFGISGNASDNTFTGTFSCEAYTPSLPPPFYYFSIGYSSPSGCPAPSPRNTGVGSDPCANVLSRSRSHSMERHSADTTNIDSATMVYLEKTALSKDTFAVLQDTNMVLGKEGVLTTLWANQYLLNNTIFRRFYDSIVNAPMGEIMAIDTVMVDSNANYSSLLSAVNAITPANNIEANLQTATWGYLTYKLNGTLSSGELTTLRTLANKCADWDGNGVYEARALLSVFDPPSTVYSDICGADNHEEHKPVRKRKL